VKHSLGTKKRKKCIADLRNWNEDLSRALVHPEVPSGDNTSKVRELKLGFNLGRCDLIRQHFKSLHKAIGAGLTCSCSSSHQAAIDLNWEASVLDGVYHCNITISYENTSHSRENSDSWQKMRVKSEPKKMGPRFTCEPIEPSALSSATSSQKSSILLSKVRFSFVPSQSQTFPSSVTSPNHACESPKIPSQKMTTETLSLATLLTPGTKITSLCDTVQKIRDPQEMSKFRGILEDTTCNQGI
jgi:hypothetical protein